MFEFKTAFCFLLVAYLLAGTNADCTIRVQQDAPIFTKKFGKKTLLLPRVEGDLPLKVGETINSHCSTGIKLSSDYDNSMIQNEAVFRIEIECSNNGDLIFKVLDPPTFARREVSRSLIYINCMRGADKLFESNKALEGCKNYTSFGFGTVLKGNKQIVVAGICFDFEALTTKYVKYLAYRSKFEFFYENKSNKSNIHITHLDTPVESLEILFKDFRKDYFDIGLNEKKLSNPLLSVHEFEFLNIVQDTELEADGITNFAYLLNTVWWRNLRVGSWKFFLNALKKRTESVKYIVYTGTSGKLTIPTTLNCEKSEVFKINGTFDVPEIIWAYVQPVKANKNDEFVVLGYNTPFYSADNETIFCKDICNEIDWLSNENFGKIHFLPAFGVMHCCRPQDIAKQLDIFPSDKLPPMSATTKMPDEYEYNEIESP